MKSSAMAIATSMIGQKFGRLTVISIVQGEHVRLACTCDCGSSKTARYDHLRSGATSSCGCLQRERASATSLQHGMSTSSEYTSWSAMISRCEDEHNLRYARYGGRGIRVCSQWRESFAGFLADMGPKPSANHSIDRIDVDGNYEPTNCRWATPVEQARNTSTNHWITVGGETLVLQDWADRLGVTQSAIRRRLDRGMSETDAIMTPFRRFRQRRTALDQVVAEEGKRAIAVNERS